MKLRVKVPSIVGNKSKSEETTVYSLPVRSLSLCCCNPAAVSCLLGPDIPPQDYYIEYLLASGKSLSEVEKKRIPSRLNWPEESASQGEKESEWNYEWERIKGNFSA